MCIICYPTRSKLTTNPRGRGRTYDDSISHEVNLNARVISVLLRDLKGCGRGCEVYCYDWTSRGGSLTDSVSRNLERTILSSHDSSGS